MSILVIFARSSIAEEPPARNPRESGTVNGQWQCRTTETISRVHSSRLTDSRTKFTFDRFHAVNPGDAEALLFALPLEPSLLHLDFRAAVSVRGSGSGARVGLQLILPHQTDPRTGQPLTTVLVGDVLSVVDEWQTLRVTVDRRRIEALERRLRSHLNHPGIQLREAVVTSLMVMAEASPGESFLDLGPAEAGPFVDVPESVRNRMALEIPEAGSPAGPQFHAIDIQLGSILIDGKPAILRIAPDHQEHPEQLVRLGLNAAWLPDYRSTARAEALASGGLAVLATPPQPQFEPDGSFQVLASLPPLDQQCPHVSAWYMGTRIPGSELPVLLAWSREVRSADRRMQRPHVADVADSENAAGREIDLVGIGQSVLGTSTSIGALRNHLIRRQQLAGQLVFPWTWIQTEPPASLVSWRSAAGSAPPVIEPEQIQHQVCAALSAGYKGIGFWKTGTLQPDDPIDRERQLAIELACLDVALLEPFLATGRLEGHLVPETGADVMPPEGWQRDPSKPLATGILSGRKPGTGSASEEQPARVDAAVIRSDRSVLILMHAWDNVSQYVPGPMFERRIRLVVAAAETASAWRISSSGIRSLPREVTAGGLALRINDLDRSEYLLVTSDTALIRTLEQRIQAIAERAARAAGELASLKYVRVLGTVEQLREAHAVPPGVDALLTSAREAVDRAEYESRQSDWRESARFAHDALRFLRQVQQSCWNDALAELSEPESSPFATSFSSLPDHWRLIHYVDRQSHRLTDNLLSVETLNTGTAAASGSWVSEPAQGPEFTATADVIRDSLAGQVLRLIAWRPDTERSPMSRHDRPVLTVTSPSVRVESGDVVIVRGRVRRGRSFVPASRRPLKILDSELGAEVALQPELGTEWQSFELLRPIVTRQEFCISLQLMTQAEVHVDDLEIRRLPASPDTPQSPFRAAGNPRPVDDSRAVETGGLAPGSAGFE